MTSSATRPDQAAAFELRLPDAASQHASQDEEWCEVVLDGTTRRLRFHDYADIYSIPGLYERLIYEELRCDSPRVIAGLVFAELNRRGRGGEALRVLDLGAGNGIVGEELAAGGVPYLVGVDIIAEASAAAARDRPGLYEEYIVGDLLDGTAGARERLRPHRLNALTCVAALGFGDIPPAVFSEALRCVETGALVAFTIKEDFLGERDPSGFAGLVDRLVGDGTLMPLARERYQHRLSWAGEPLHYVAVLAEKRAEL
jgi:SAM-dependent methyltransferase